MCIPYPQVVFPVWDSHFIMSPPHEIFQLGMDGYCHHQACSVFTLSAHSIESIVGPLNMVVSVVLQHTGVPVGVDCEGNNAIFKVN